MNCKFRAIALALAALSLVTLGACATPSSSSGAGRFSAQQPAMNGGPGGDTGTQFGTD